MPSFDDREVRLGSKSDEDQVKEDEDRRDEDDSEEGEGRDGEVVHLIDGRLIVVVREERRRRRRKEIEEGKSIKDWVVRLVREVD